MATGCLLRESHFYKSAPKRRTSLRVFVRSGEMVSGLCVGPHCLLPSLNRPTLPAALPGVAVGGLPGRACGLLSASLQLE